MIRPSSLLLVLAGPASAEIVGPAAPTPAAARVMEGYARTCADEEAGDLVVAPEAYRPADLDGDGAEDDLVIDMAHAHCRLALTLWAGSGGAPLHFVVDEVGASWFGANWQLVDVAPPAEEGEAPGPPLRAILMAQHGSLCDSYGAAPCLRAIVWDGAAFVSLPGPE